MELSRIRNALLLAVGCLIAPAEAHATTILGYVPCGTGRSYFYENRIYRPNPLGNLRGPFAANWFIGTTDGTPPVGYWFNKESPNSTIYYFGAIYEWSQARLRARCSVAVDSASRQVIWDERKVLAYEGTAYCIQNCGSYDDEECVPGAETLREQPGGDIDAVETLDFGENPCDPDDDGGGGGGGEETSWGLYCDIDFRWDPALRAFVITIDMASCEWREE